MLSVKAQLLEALTQALEILSPGAGVKAVFESPKLAAHGDLATTAAMQLAKPLEPLTQAVKMLAPGAGVKAFLQPPKLAAQGALAATAAIKLAKPLKQN